MQLGQTDMEVLISYFAVIIDDFKKAIFPSQLALILQRYLCTKPNFFIIFLSCWPGGIDRRPV